MLFSTNFTLRDMLHFSWFIGFTVEVKPNENIEGRWFDLSMKNSNYLNEERFYVFDKFPENIKQIGEQPEENRIYVEDYVVTYMHRIFREKAENSLVVFVGKKGKGAAQGGIFVYGAIEVEMDLLLWREQFTAQVWDGIHEQVHQYFSEGEVLGWGCGVNIGNSEIKKAVAGIQRKHFSREGQILFYWDYSEEEESVCRWENGGVQSVPGYLIYYGKNPKMQEYMLRGKEKESFEAGYKDTVMESVRTVIQKKEHLKQEKKPAFFAAGGMLLVLVLVGGWLLVQSSRKIEDLESAIMTLSQEPLDKPSPSQRSEGGDGKGNKNTAVPSSTGEFADFEKKSLDIKSSAVPQAAATQKPSVSKKPAATQVPSVSGKPAATQKPSVSGKPVATRKPSDPGTPAATQKPPASPKSPGGSAGGKNNNSAGGGNATGTSGVTRANSYVVQKGDTLSQIVWRQYHTMAYMEQVKKINNIQNENEIQIGQRIILPLYRK